MLIDQLNFQISNYTRIFETVKKLSFILACYVFCLSVSPLLSMINWQGQDGQCTKELCAETHDEGVPLACTDAAPDDCCDDGVCNNPFDSCMGFTGFTLPPLPRLTTSDAPVSTQPQWYKQVVPRLANHAVWHPPQLV